MARDEQLMERAVCTLMIFLILCGLGWLLVEMVLVPVFESGKFLRLEHLDGGL